MKLPFFVTTALLLTLSLSAFSPKELEIGAKAPKTSVKLLDVSGSEVTLESLMGKNGLLVIFSCNTCPYVVAWEDRYPKLAELAKELGIGMVLVNSNEGQRDGVDSFEEMAEHAKEKKYTFPYVVDTNSELADAFGANRTPHVFLFSDEWLLKYRGAIDDNFKNADKVEQPYLMNAMKALASGMAIDPEATKSLGCSIKRKS